MQAPTYEIVMSLHNSVMHRVHNPDLGLLFVRVAVGLVFIHAGWGKVTDIAAVAGFFGGLGIPAWLAYVVAYVEFLGGIAVVLGIFVRHAGILLAIIMLVAIWKVHWVNGLYAAEGGYESQLVLFLASLTLMTSGGGKYSLARLLKGAR
jgi:putative oxidoreductase